MTREDIATALLALLTAASAFPTTGRRLVMWNQVAEQPALFLRNAGEHHDRTASRMPGRITLDFEVWLYSRGGADPDIAPATALNGLLDAVEAALNPFPLEAQTLGGLVTHCWIDGSTDYHPGDLDGQAIAVVPVKVLVPTFGG